MIQLPTGYLLSIAMLIVLSDHSKGRKVSKRTMGGDLTYRNEFRHHVAIQSYYEDGVNEYYLYTCGGSIIHMRWVVSAATCFYDKKKQQINITSFRVLTGIQNLEYPYLPNQKDKITRAIYPDAVFMYEHHPDIDISSHNIALLRFSEESFYKFVKGFYVKIVKMAYDIPHPKQTYLAVGYLHKRILAKITVPTVDPKRCYKAYGHRNYDFDWHICAGYLDGKEAPCKNDAGGGLVTLIDSEYRLHGIINDETCGFTQRPGRYTSIYHYVEWIISTINDHTNIEGVRYKEPTPNYTSKTRW